MSLSVAALEDRVNSCRVVLTHPECWLGYAYAGAITMPNGSRLNIDRNDGAYPTPHWGGKFVILVDDGDAAQPPDKEGRVTFH